MAQCIKNQLKRETTGDMGLPCWEDPQVRKQQPTPVFLAENFIEIEEPGRLHTVQSVPKSLTLLSN